MRAREEGEEMSAALGRVEAGSTPGLETESWVL
jgi:hypothetical protein